MIAYVIGISIHVSSWGTTIASIPDIASFPFQSSFPRGERQYTIAHDCRGNGISIHVPSWGTTTAIWFTSCFIVYFNPRSLVGNDGNRAYMPMYHAISIHVPSWGTTYLRDDFCTFLPFQSTFPRGERRTCRRMPAWTDYFNPRSLVGNDLSRLCFCLLVFNFNPRSLVGNDRRQTESCTPYTIFQSTFPRGND